MNYHKAFQRLTGHIFTMTIIFILFSGLGYSQEDQKIINGNDKEVASPIAKKIKKELTIHGHTRIDYYYWLNQRENPEVVKHLEAEIQYKNAVLKPTEELQKKLYDEIVGRIKKTDMSVPYKYRGYYYYQRYKGDGEYPIYCRKEGNLKNKEEKLLDVNEMAMGYDFFHVAGHSISPDNNMLAYGVDTVSRRKYTIYFKNLKSGEILKDELTNTTGRAVWANDNKTVFYSTKDNTLRSYKIFKHVIGTDVLQDREIFHEKDPTFATYVFKSKSRKYIFIGSFHTLSSEYWFINADYPTEQFKIIQKREKNLEYDVDQYGDYFYIKTNYLAKNFKLIKAPIASPSKENWLLSTPTRIRSSRSMKRYQYQ